MRVLFLNPVGGLGGAERCLLDMLAGLRREVGLEPHLLSFSDGPLLREARALGVPSSFLALPTALHETGDFALVERDSSRWATGTQLLTTALQQSPGLVRYVLSLQKAVAAHHPDILHTNGMKAHLLGALVRPKLAKLVWHMHDFLGQRPLLKTALAAVARRAQLVIANSQAVASDAREALGSLRVETVYNAIDTEVFAPGPSRGPLLDPLSGLSAAPDGTIRVGLVATYARWKGQDVFLRAAAELIRSRPAAPWRFYIIGGPIYATAGSQYSQAELSVLARELNVADHVGFVPFQQEPQEIYRRLDIVVHASTRPEPFGRTIVEAMATEKAVIVAQAGGALELFTEGIDAMGYTQGDWKGLARTIAQLENSTVRSKLGRAARATAVSRFSRVRLGPELVELYRSLGR